MKFLTELGSCCSCTSATTQSSPEHTIPDGSTTTSTCDASSSSLTSSVFKGKTRMLRCKSAMHWQPGLSSISEDGLVSIVEEGGSSTDDVVVVSQKKLSSSSSIKAKSIAKARSFSYSNYDYEEEYNRRKRLFRIPAFSQLSAAPYMF